MSNEIYKNEIVLHFDIIANSLVEIFYLILNYIYNNKLAIKI